MAGKQSHSLGLLGRYYAVRHDLGHYRSAAVTATYTVDLPCQLQTSVWLRNTFERALQYTILGNPGLCFGIEKSGPECTAGFKQLAEIQSGDVVKYLKIDVVHAGMSVDDHLSRVIGAAHSYQWVAGKPAWRTIVSYQASTKSAPGAKEAETSRVTINVTFLAHHAIADGLSGMAFHMSLMSHLGEVPEVGIEAAWPLSLPHDVPAPASIDHLLGLHDISDNVSEEVNDPVWAGGAILLPSTNEDTSRVRLITISNDRLLEILDVCKRNRTTLTGLLHGLICVTLLRHVEDARAFRSVTPYSIRKFTDADAMDIVNHISFITQYVPSAVLDELQATKTGSPAESCLILKMASAFGGSMKAELGRFPKNNAWATLHHITDLEAHCRDQIGTAREYTYELSNLGTMRVAPTTGGGIILERLIFTQCGMVAGPALGINCASVQGGPLIISITWQDGIVEEDLVGHVARELEQRLVTASDTFATV